LILILREFYFGHGDPLCFFLFFLTMICLQFALSKKRYLHDQNNSNTMFFRLVKSTLIVDFEISTFGFAWTESHPTGAEIDNYRQKKFSARDPAAGSML